MVEVETQPSWCEARGRASAAAAMPGWRKPTRLPIDAPEFDLHEVDAPITTRGFSEPDQLAADGFAHEDELTPPLDLPAIADASDLVGRVVPRILHSRGIGPRRRRIQAGGRLLPEGFVGAFGVELATHAVEASLLRRRRGGGRRRGLLLEREMKSLMTTILLGMPAINPIELNAELQPPDGEMR